jgi:2'-5' RNA ligase
MPLSVQLFFDTKTETAIGELWNKFSIHGICGYLAQSSSRPHVSLSVFEGIPEESACDVIKKFSEIFIPFELCFTAHGRFPKTKIIFLHPNMTNELIEKQIFIEENLIAAGAQVWPQYSKSLWIPHCTIAMYADLSKAQLIYDILDTLELPMHITVQEIGLVRFRPTIQIKSFKLAALQ